MKRDVSFCINSVFIEGKVILQKKKKKEASGMHIKYKNSNKTKVGLFKVAYANHQELFITEK